VGTTPSVANSSPPDLDAWQQTIYESLRGSDPPIDPQALFWVGLVETDLEDTPGQELGEFPGAELREELNAWLSELDPQGREFEHEWKGGGVRLRFRAKGRTPAAQGWREVPSFNLLEEAMSDLHLVDGGRRQFISLTLDEVRRLAAGELHVVGQRGLNREIFQMLAQELQYAQQELVGELDPLAITAFAGRLGLVEATSSLEDFEHGWQSIDEN
jgi:hypothetical protein